MNDLMVSFSEITSDQFENYPIYPGEILFIKDTKKIYHTSADGIRREMSNDLSIVLSLPDVGMENHLYVVASGGAMGFYIYINGKWKKIATSDTTVDLTGTIQVSPEKPEDQIVGGLWFISDREEL